MCKRTVIALNKVHFVTDHSYSPPPHLHVIGNHACFDFTFSFRLNEIFLCLGVLLLTQYSSGALNLRAIALLHVALVTCHK
jgi:hypothetical protein